VREDDFAEGVHLRPFAHGAHRAREIAQAVGGKNRRAIERRNKVGAREVRGVVFDAMELGANAFGRDLERRGEVPQQGSLLREAILSPR
jgi:hypothetical protein